MATENKTTEQVNEQAERDILNFLKEGHDLERATRQYVNPSPNIETRNQRALILANLIVEYWRQGYRLRREEQSDE